MQTVQQPAVKQRYRVWPVRQRGLLSYEHLSPYASAAHASVGPYSRRSLYCLLLHFTKVGQWDLLLRAEELTEPSSDRASADTARHTSPEPAVSLNTGRPSGWVGVDPTGLVEPTALVHLRPHPHTGNALTILDLSWAGLLVPCEARCSGTRPRGRNFSPYTL